MERKIPLGYSPLILFLSMLLASLAIVAPQKTRHPVDYEEDYSEDDDEEPEPLVERAEPSASGSSGRVKIQVFRGPTRHSGNKDEEEWAPWGFYVSQPAHHGSSRYQ